RTPERSTTTMAHQQRQDDGVGAPLADVVPLPVGLGYVPAATPGVGQPPTPAPPAPAEEVALGAVVDHAEEVALGAVVDHAEEVALGAVVDHAEEVALGAVVDHADERPRVLTGRALPALPAVPAAA